VKLSKLLEAIEPITANRLNTGSGGQESKNGAETYQVPTPLPEDNPLDSEIGSIHYRAQEVQPGGMFVAIEGQTADGHDFMHQALKRGAAAIVTQKEPPQPFLNEFRAASPKNRPIIIRVPNTRIALADLAARFFGHPSQSMTLIGIITGICIGIGITTYFQIHGIDFSGGSELLSQFGITGRMYPKLSLLSVSIGPFMVLFFTFFAALYPALKVRRLRPVEAMTAI